MFMLLRFMTSALSLISNYCCVCNLQGMCYALSLPYGSEFSELICKVSNQSIGVGSNREDSVIDF